MPPIGGFLPYVLSLRTMEQHMVMISRAEVEHLIRMATRAEGFCRKARPVTYPQTQEDLFAEPTEFYSGASGYARATLQEVIQSLESAL